jgi:hypothetical protein
MGPNQILSLKTLFSFYLFVINFVLPYKEKHFTSQKAIFKTTLHKNRYSQKRFKI